jgi:hypothetical protein
MSAFTDEPVMFMHFLRDSALLQCQMRAKLLPASLSCDRIHHTIFLSGSGNECFAVYLSQLFKILSTACALRKLAVAVLAVSLLAAIAPFNISSMAAHSCSMPCCAGGACSTGACGFNFAAPVKEAEAESHCEHDSNAMTHAVASESEHESSAMEISDELCGAPNVFESVFKSSDFILPPESLSRTASVTTQAFSEPCSAECGAGTSAFSQFRRSRETAALGQAYRPRPPTLGFVSENFSHLASLNARWRRQSPPRAPPLST